MFKGKLLHIIILLIGFSGFSQVDFTTKLSKNQLGLNERIKVEFSVDKDGDNFTPPKFENFRIVGGPSQSIRNSWINDYCKTQSTQDETFVITSLSNMAYSKSNFMFIFSKFRFKSFSKLLISPTLFSIGFLFDKSL